MLIECKSMKSAFFSLFAVHYIFNIEYHTRVKYFYRFVQENFLIYLIDLKRVLILLMCLLASNHYRRLVYFPVM